MDNVCYTIVKKEEGDILYRIKSQWFDLNCKLDILDNENAWHVEVNEEYIKNYAEMLNTTAPEYFANVRKYISDPPENVEFRLGENKFYVYFITEKKKRIKYFYADVQMISYESTLKSWLDEVIVKNKILSKDLKTRQEKTNKVQVQINDCRAKFEDYVKEMREKEKRMVGGFVLLLNTKKRYIQFLSEVIEANKYNIPEYKSQDEDNNCEKIEMLSDSGSEDYNTDDEKNNDNGEHSEDEKNTLELLDVDDYVTDLAPRESGNKHKLSNNDGEMNNVNNEFSQSKKIKVGGDSEENWLNLSGSNNKEDESLAPTVTLAEDQKETLENFEMDDILDRL